MRQSHHLNLSEAIHGLKAFICASCQLTLCSLGLFVIFHLLLPEETQAQPYLQPTDSQQTSAPLPANDLQNQPLVVPPISFVDINSGRFDKLEINLLGGQFLDGSVDQLHLVAKNMDLAKGLLACLNVEVTGGHFQDFTLDHLKLNTQGALIFDTGILFNHRMLQFSEPALAEVTAVVTQKSLNLFLNSPNTLNRLAVVALKKSSFLSNLLGASGNLISFASGNVLLERDNHLEFSLDSRLAVGNVTLPIPLQLSTKMTLQNGWVYLSDTHLLTSGQEISPLLSQMIVDRVNSLSAWGQRSDDIQFNFTDLRVVPQDRFVLTGTAAVRRLRFGRSAL